MPGVTPVLEHGPHSSFQVSSSVRGGQLVSAQSDGTVAPSAAGDTTVLGVATTDAEPNQDGVYSSTPYGASVTDLSWPRDHVSVGYRGVWRLNASGDVTFGQLVVAGADGTVTAATAGTSAYATIVGRCVAPEGITNGARGKVLVAGIGAS